MPSINGYNTGNIFNSFQTTTSASTTSTSLVTLGTIFLPANTFVLGDVVRTYALFDKINANNGYDVRFYWNTSNNLTGSPVLFGVFSAGTATASSYGLYRKIFINGTSGTQSYGFPTSLATLGNDLNETASALEVFTINWTVDSYIIAAARVLSASDTMNFRYMRVAVG
jgi:hypothetical protein